MPHFTLPIKFPIDGPYKWDKFGVVRPLSIDPSRRPHDGVDLRSKTSHDVFAVEDGRVVVNTSAMGSYIAIDHDGGYRSIYVHLVQRLVSVGAPVKKGQKIGVYGVIGLSTGAHLHFMVRKNGVAIDPEPLIFNSNNNNSMSEKEQAINVIKELEPTNGQTRTKRIIDAINTNDWSYFAFEYAVIQKGLTKSKEDINELESKLAEAPESAVVEQLEAKQEEIDQLKQALDDQTQKLNKIETDRMRVYNHIQDLESKPGPKPVERFDWNKFLVGLSKDQTFQRGLRHTVTFAIGVLASQFPEYAPYILGLAGVWGLGTEVQAFQVNQKQIVKEKK
jgi:hypothetical protein